MNVPKLRFKEFDGEFIKYNIEQLVEVTDCKHDTAPVEAEKTIYKMIRTGNVRNGNLLVETMDSVSEDTFHKWSLRGYLEPNDIILTREAPMGEVAMIPKNSKYNFFLGQRCLQLKSNAELADSVYIYFLLQGKRFQKYIRPLKSSGSTVSNIRIPELKSFEFEIPDIKEQIKVGDFLGEINKKIQLQQQKIDLLQEQKKGFLQKMFPKAGETQPEMRFDGFMREWEERKLREVANHRGGTAIEKYFDDNGDYKVISIGSYGLDNKYVDQNIRAISNDITDSRLVKKGELTMVLNDKTSNGTIIGRSLLIEKDNEFVVNQRTEIISPKTAFDSAFAYVTLNGPFREKVRKIVQGGTQIYVNYSAVENLNLLVPQIEEQKKIGSFFKQLDNVITFQQQKLELFQKQKQGFMQQMFI